MFSLDKLGLESVALLGHSLGGRVVMETALRFPDRVKQLVVADVGPTRVRHGTSPTSIPNIVCDYCMLVVGIV